MKNSQKKNIGIALVVLGAVLMILATVIPALGDLLDQNIYTAGSAFLVIAGIIVHIWLNKKLPLDDEPKGITYGQWPEWMQHPDERPSGRTTFVAWKHWNADDALMPSGLAGPVIIKPYVKVKIE